LYSISIILLYVSHIDITNSRLVWDPSSERERERERDSVAKSRRVDQTYITVPHTTIIEKDIRTTIACM
jgi:hypothetical protein